MANFLQPTTLQDIQDQINALASFSTDTPDPTDDQWLTRLQYINLAVQSWANSDVMWRELFVPYTGGGTLSGATSYPINAKDFTQLSSLLRLYDDNGNIIHIDIIKPENVIAYQPNSRVAYVTGNQAIGYTLNLGWTPQPTDVEYGNPFDFDYVSSGVKLLNPTDKAQMSDPSYIVYTAAATELMFNGRTDLAQNFQVMAQQSMDGMRIMNELMPAYADNTLDDVDKYRDNFVWGE